MDFEKLQKISTSKENIKLSSLEMNKQYIIYDVQAKTTKFGRAILVDLGEFCSWLPKRYEKVFTDEAIPDINKNYSGKMELIVKEVKMILNNSSAIIEINKIMVEEN